MKILKTIRDSDFGFDTPIPNSYNEYKAARGIVFDTDHNVALLHSKKVNYHKLPGGMVESGEEIIDAFKREILEEIGCVTANIRELGIIEEYWDKLSIHQFSYYFFADLDGEKGLPTFTKNETQDDLETLWLPIDTIIDILEKEIVRIENYRGKFLNTRDIFCLKEIKKIFRF
jgi:ADP-ribose pyrophosphatase YjhB (NUDIX family)